MTWVIGADLGTSGCKVAVFDERGHVVAATVRNYDTHYPQPGHHEQSIEDWWTSVCAAVKDLVGMVDDSAAQIRAIALSGQSLALIPLDASGAALQAAVPIWSDTRAHSECQEYFSDSNEEEWYLRTGNGFPAPLYTLFKLMWMRSHRPEVFEKTVKVLGSKDWINYRLTGHIATDPSYASGLGAFDLQGGRYSDELLGHAGFGEELFPEIIPSSARVGHLTSDVAQALGLSPSVEVFAGGVDNSCMALGALNTAPGRVYAALGSSSWLTLCDTMPILDTALRPFVFAHVIPGLFNSAVSTFASGTSARWATDTFFPQLEGDIDALVEMAIRSELGAGGAIFVPTINGGTVFEGGPDVRGSLVGLSGGLSPEHIARAVIEAIPMALRRPLDRLRELTTVSDSMIVTGGGAQNSGWLQVYADVLDSRLVKTNIDQQAATLGAAALALVGSEVWDSLDQVEDSHTIEESLEPDPARSKRYEQEVLPRFAAAAHHAHELSTL